MIGSTFNIEFEITNVTGMIAVYFIDESVKSELNLDKVYFV